MKKRNIVNSPTSADRRRFEREATGWQLLPAAEYNNSSTLPPPPGASVVDDDGSLEHGGHDGPCTITIRRRVEKEKREEFKIWQKGITEQNFEFEGFESATLLQEAVNDLDAEDDIMFIVILRYSSYAAAAEWHRSDERRGWLEKIAEMELKHEPIQADINFDELPIVDLTRTDDGNNGQRSRVPPMSRFWMWFSIWMQVFSLVEFYEWILPKLLNWMWDPETRSFHIWLLLGTFMSTITIELLTMNLILKVREKIYLTFF